MDGSIWRGSKNFEGLLQRAGYSRKRADLARLVEDLSEHCTKPPTVDSLLTACLSKRSQGYKKTPVNAAIALVLDCNVMDLYEPTQRPDSPENPSRHRSVWERLTEGRDLDDIKARRLHG